MFSKAIVQRSFFVETSTSPPGDEMDSNYTQLLKLRGEDDPRIFEWIKKKTDKYTSGEMQNEMMKVMSLQILREGASALQNTAYYTIMIDETADISNQEQVVVCFRWVRFCLTTFQMLPTGLYIIYWKLIFLSLMNYNLIISIIPALLYFL